jgi:hypothetical protein
MQIDILTFIKESKVFQDHIDLINSKLPVTEAIFSYCKDNSINNITIDLNNGEYIDFKILNGGNFDVAIKNIENDEIKLQCDKYTKKSFDEYIRKIISEQTKVEIVNSTINDFKNLHFRTGYLKKEGNDKNISIQRTLKMIAETKLFNDNQLKAFKKFMENNIDINIISSPLYSYNQMNIIYDKYTELRKTMPEEELQQKFLHFKEKIELHLEERLSRIEFAMLWESFMNRTLDYDLNNPRYMARLKCAYLLSKSYGLNMPIEKTYANSTFIFNCTKKEATAEERFSGTAYKIDMVCADGSLEEIYNSENNTRNLTPFIDAFLGHQVVKSFNKKVPDYITQLKEHSMEEDYSLNLILKDDTVITVAPFVDGNENSIIVFVNGVLQYSDFDSTHENMELLNMEIDMHGGIKEIKEPIEMMENSISVPDEYIDDLFKKLTENNVSYQVDSTIIENGIKKVKINFKKETDEIVSKAFNEILSENNINEEKIKIIEEKLKRALAGEVIEDKLSDKCVIKYETCTILDKPMCNIMLYYEGFKPRLLYGGEEYKNDIYMTGSMHTVASEYSIHGRALDYVPTSLDERY